ncbi:hypothetical protein ACTXT7_001345 [Hymenolepis weldensis]
MNAGMNRLGFLKIQRLRVQCKPSKQNGLPHGLEPVYRESGKIRVSYREESTQDKCWKTLPLVGLRVIHEPERKCYRIPKLYEFPNLFHLNPLEMPLIMQTIRLQLHALGFEYSGFVLYFPSEFIVETSLLIWMETVQVDLNGNFHRPPGPRLNLDDLLAAPSNICALSTNLNEIRRSTTSQLDEILKRLSNLEEASSKPIMRDKEKGEKTKKSSHKKQDISLPVSNNSVEPVHKETEMKSSRNETTSGSSKSTKKDINKSTDQKRDKECDHDHVDDGGIKSKEEGEKLINRMADALRKAREDGLPQSLNKKPPLSAASNYLMTHNIRKRILHVGNPSKMPAECTAPGGGIAYPKHTKFIFDYRIGDPDTPEDFLDDTKKYGKKMELYSGKDFQIEFWEYCLQTMMVGEVSSFMVPPSQLSAFPMVNKKLRDYMLNRTPDSANPSKHACAFMSLQAQGGLGYPDLDEFLLKPKMLEFVFDLHSVILPNEAPKESWIMTPEEKVEAIPRLRKEGNDLYAQGQWFNSAAKYEEALNLIEQLILVEKPGEPEYEQLDQSRVPFYVNLAQCQFKLKDYYGAIRSASEALTRDKDNVKALFRRAQAHSATSDVQLAEADYMRVKELAPDTMTACVNRELANLERITRECEEQKRRLLAGKFFKMQNS